MIQKRLLAVGMVLIVVPIPGCFNRQRFDAAEWKKDPGSRYRMLDNLIESRYLMGMTKSEVISSLDTVDVKQYNYQDDTWMYIIMKPAWIPATDSPVEVMDIYFKENKVDTVIKRD